MLNQDQIDADAELTEAEREQKLQDARTAYDAVAPASVSQLHTYPDGSARVGTAPFPELSPLQEADAKLERVSGPDPVAIAAAQKKLDDDRAAFEKDRAAFEATKAPKATKAK